MRPHFRSLKEFIRCRKAWHQFRPIRRDADTNDLSSIYLWTRDNGCKLRKVEQQNKH